MLKKLFNLVLVVALVIAFLAPAPAFAARLKICKKNATGGLFVSGNCGKKATQVANISELQGQDGQNGQNGTDGANFYDTLPSGVTITGVIGGDFDSADDTGDWRAFHSFPAPIGRVLTDADVIVANTSEIATDCGGSSCLSPDELAESTACTGAATAPTAPAGKVCLYPAWSGHVQEINGLSVEINGDTITKGFVLDWDMRGTSGDTYLVAVWAYTQP